MENGWSGIFKASDSARVIRDVGVCFFTDQKKKFLTLPQGLDYQSRSWNERYQGTQAKHLDGK